ncbi:MAG: tetratricopeptide repeat protein [candidate division WOR-3 bacterium]|nr:tetratricopeptide repeat protein [candidate division WOR-3 bacterium]
MNAILALILLLISSASDVLFSLEKRLDAGFNEATYRRYLYYCRQQDQGQRLAEQSKRWLEEYPDRDILRFGIGEGLLMSGDERTGLARFRELYADSPQWANEIIFTLNEVGNKEVAWFIAQERKRIANPTLHARIMIEHHLANTNERKALSELAAAISAGANPENFRRSIDVLSERLGKEKVLQGVKGASEELHFQLALELGDAKEIEQAINSTTDERKLAMMGSLCERAEYPGEALLAYERAGRRTDAARMLIALGRTEEAQKMLEGDSSRKGREQRALLLAGSADTYKDAIAEFKDLQRRYGSRPEWSLRIAALELLQGNERNAGNALEGIAADSAVCFLQGVIAAAKGELDLLKGVVDRCILRFPGNAYENDLLLLYAIALTRSREVKQYGLALAAYHWGDAEDAYNRSIRIAEKNENLADEALLLAAESLSLLGRWKEAETAYLKLVENYPKSPLNTCAQYKRAMLLKEKLDNPLRAKEIFEDLILRNPTSLYADLARQEM